MLVMTWSQAFDAWLAVTGKTMLEYSHELKVSPSVIHYWRKKSKPRSKKIRAKIERDSKGLVRADL